jgi:hypothetical protein
MMAPAVEPGTRTRPEYLLKIAGEKPAQKNRPIRLDGRLATYRNPSKLEFPDELVRALFLALLNKGGEYIRRQPSVIYANRCVNVSISQEINFLCNTIMTKNLCYLSNSTFACQIS